MNPKTFFTTYRLPILSGILIGTSYIPYPPWAIYFCFAPLWLFWLKETSLKKVFFSGWISQFILTLIGFNWVAHTISEFGHIPMPIALLALLIFCGFANLYIPIAGWVWAYCHKTFKLSKTSSLLLLPVVTALGERLYPMIFDWNYGYSLLWAQAPIAQWAEVIGFEGLSIMAIFLNVPLLLFWTHRKSKKGKKILWGVVSFIALFNISGWALKKRLPPNDSQAHVLIVQANIGNLEKQMAEKGRGFQSHIANTYFELTRKGLKKFPHPVDFVVWPETAFPERLTSHNLNFGFAKRLSEFVKDNQVHLVSGVYSLKLDTGQTTNSLATFTPEGIFSDTLYHKNFLLAFGEFIPGAEQFPILKRWLPQVADFARGEGPQVKTINNIQIGPQICYEGLFPHFSKDLANQGAQIFVNLTNDSWFGTWQEPYQHLYMTLARAIEFRRPVVRSTNTGISTVALADGTILAQSPLHKKWTQAFQIPYSSKPRETFYQKWGIHLVSGFLYLYLAIVLLKGWRERPLNS